MTSPIIVALDLERDLALDLAKSLDPNNCRLKVGSQLFTSAGPGVIEELSTLGFDIFLDLKFHDIPSTVAQSVKIASNLGVWMLNVHTSGGSIMMKAANRPRCISTQKYSCENAAALILRIPRAQSDVVLARASPRGPRGLRTRPIG